MAFTMKNPPEFTLDVRQWDRETDADGVEMAKEIEKLLNNDAYLKENLEELEGNAVVVGDKGVPGGVASLGSDGKVAQHVDYSKVDNVPAMTWGNVTGKPFSFPPSAHTHTKSEVGLNNVDNTADASKRVSYAASAGDADTLDGKHASAFSLASHSHSSVPSATNAGNADTVDGFHASQTPGAKSACVVTNASGYLMAGYINTNVSEENPAIGQFIVINTGKDGYFRKASLAHVKAALGLGTFTLGASVPAGAKFTDTTYSNMRGATASAAGGAGLVPAPAAGAATRYLRSDGTWQVPPNTNTTYSAATQSAAGLMSAADKKKLDGVAAGAQVNPGAATQSAAGLMSAADKKKLDGIVSSSAVKFDSQGLWIEIDGTRRFGLHAFVGSTKGDAIVTNDPSGIIVCDSNWNTFRPIQASSFVTHSTKKVKRNLEEISEEDACKILSIISYWFEYSYEPGKKRSGFLAEEIEKIYPEICCYRTQEDGTQELFGLDYSKFTPYIVKMLQIQQKRLEELTTLVQKQQEELQEFRSQLPSVLPT